MKNFIPVWKKLAQDKENTAVHAFHYCILKAMAAQSEEKVDIAVYFLQKAFTAVTNKNKLNNGWPAYRAVAEASEKRHFRKFLMITDDKSGLSSLSSVCSELYYCLETEEEQTTFNKIAFVVVELLYGELKQYYSYIFVRQDIPMEQTLVQACHAAVIIGWDMHVDDETKVFPDHLNLVVCGVKDEATLEEIYLNTWPIKKCRFHEPDMMNQLTAFGTEPISGNKRRVFKKYKLLKFPIVEYYNVPTTISLHPYEGGFKFNDYNNAGLMRN
jgi:hypothetical protein